MENKLIDDCMKLGFGMMRLPRVEGTIATPHSDQRLENDIDLEHTKRMVDAFIEAGGKYFDTAYIYEGSEARNEYRWRPGGALASACIVCGQCQTACPQHLPIIGLLAEVAETLE